MCALHVCLLCSVVICCLFCVLIVVACVLARICFCCISSALSRLGSFPLRFGVRLGAFQGGVDCKRFWSVRGHPGKPNE